MDHGFFAAIIDRIVANVRVIRGAPEAIALTATIAVGLSSFGFQQFHRERVAGLTETIGLQERLLTDYRVKLKAAEEAEGQIEKLTGLLADAQKSLSVAKSKPASVEDRSRDPRRLYEADRPIALVHDPKIDLDKRKITFPAVNAEVILNVNKSYEFQGWKLACGSTQLYSMVSDGSGREYSYSPLTCKIVGSR